MKTIITARPSNMKRSPMVARRPSGSTLIDALLVRALAGSTPQMSLFAFIEDHMSITSAGAAERVNAPRQQSYLWIAVLILGAVVACAVAAWFFTDTPLVDTLMIAT